MAAPPPSPLDGNQVLQHAFEDATGRLRVDAALSPSGSATEVIISHVDDSIRLGDGTSLVTTTTVGSNVGLDVNIVNTSLPVIIGGSTTPLITQIPMATAGTEYSHIFTSGTKQFQFRSQKRGTIQIGFSSGESATNYFSSMPGNIPNTVGLNLTSSVTMYFQSTKNSDILEIWSWS